MPNKFIVKLIACIAIALVALLLELTFGGSAVAFSDFLLWASGTKVDPTTAMIIQELRLPRALVAAVCGAGLSVAGVLTQGLFRNPLASPSLLGQSSGGTLGALVFVALGPTWAQWYGLPGSAFVGTLLSSLILMHLSARRSQWGSEGFLLLGVTLATLFSALSSLVISLLLADVKTAAFIMRWMLGGFSGCGWEQLMMVVPPTVLGGGLVWWLAPSLDVLALGEAMAQTLGLRIRLLRSSAIFALACLVGGAVAVAGALPFVGLIVPHVSRRLFGPTHRTLVGTSAINGMTLTLLADVIGRTVIAPQELEVGILTSLVGALFFLSVLL